MPTPLPLADVRLRPGPLRDAQQRGLETILALDPDRLLAPFRREAGLDHGDGYGGWESDGLDGHILGHVLSGLAFHEASGSRAAADRIDTLVQGLRECQSHTAGYLGGIPDGLALWDELAAGDARADTFHLNGRWVPLYNLHKVLTGLIDVVEHTGCPEADRVLTDLTAWWRRALDALPGDTRERILATEFGGMTTAFARLALLRRDPDLLDVARSFAHRALLDPLAAGLDELDGLHANTQIPVVVGYATIARAARDLGSDGETFATAARTFWHSVAGRRSVAIGGNSVREHFHDADDFETMFTSREGPETCNTYNMVQLAGELYQLDGDDAYLAFAERATANHLLSAQHPEHGGFVYFTSQRPGHYRVSSAPASGFWCCVGTGLEMHARHGALVFADGGADAGADELRIDLPFAAATTHDGLHVAVDTEYPFGDTARLTVTAETPVERTLSVRVPEGALRAVVDAGARTAGPGERLRLRRRWEGTTVIEIGLPPRLRWEPAPDGSAWGWIVDGPRVLAQAIVDDELDYVASDTRMGHIARGPLRPLADAPLVDPAQLADAERRGDGTVIITTATGDRVSLVPFAALHDARYVLSFPRADAGAAETRHAELAAIDAAALSLDARTRDAVVFGEQQPESDHAFDGSAGSTTGTLGARRWRRTDARVGVTLHDWSATATTLRLEWAGDGSPARVELRVDGTLIGEVHDDGSHVADAVVITDLDVSAHADGRVEWPLVLAAAEGLPTPRLLGLRLLAAVSDSP